MARFVWLNTKDQGVMAVNLDLVRYVRKGPAGKPCLVYGAFAGGFDQLELGMSWEAALAALGAPEHPEGARDVYDWTGPPARAA
jgi:hypothetical protein